MYLKLESYTDHKISVFAVNLELIEDPISEEKERRRRAIDKWTEESHEEFTNG